MSGGHADGCAYYFADAMEAESLCDCKERTATGGRGDGAMTTTATTAEGEQGARRALPVGFAWYGPTREEVRGLYHVEDKQRDNAYALIDADHYWMVYPGGDIAIGGTGSAADDEAAQTAAVEALWAAGGFGDACPPLLLASGRLVCIEEGPHNNHRSASGVKWANMNVRTRATQSVEVDAVRAPVAEPSPLPTDPKCDACVTCDCPGSCRVDEDGLCVHCGGVPSEIAERFGAPHKVSECKADKAEPAPREPSAPDNAASAPPTADVWGYADSDDAEEWHGSLDTREEAIAEGCAEIDPASDVWITRGTMVDPGDAMPRARTVLAWMLDTASDRVEWCETATRALDAALKRLPPEAIEELDTLLKAWARKRIKVNAWQTDGKPEKARSGHGDE